MKEDSPESSDSETPDARDSGSVFSFQSLPPRRGRAISKPETPMDSETDALPTQRPVTSASFSVNVQAPVRPIFSASQSYSSPLKKNLKVILSTPIRPRILSPSMVGHRKKNLSFDRSTETTFLASLQAPSLMIPDNVDPVFVQAIESPAPSPIGDRFLSFGLEGRPPPLNPPSFLVGHSEEKRDTRERKEYAEYCSQLTDFLFLGGQKVAMNRPLLLQNGITHVINCASNECDNFYETDFTYLNLHLRDRVDEDLTCIMYEAFDFIDECRRAHQKVFVHCKEGVSRSASLCIGYLMFLQNQDFQETCEFVQSHRPVSQPNLGFATSLLAWQQRRCNSDGHLHRLYRIAPQSRSDPNRIVAKWMDKVDKESLDPRGVYLLSSLHYDKNFIWTGSLCQKTKPFLACAQKHVSYLQRYEKAPTEVRRLDHTSLEPEWLEAFGMTAQGDNKINTNPAFDVDYDCLPTNRKKTVGFTFGPDPDDVMEQDEPHSSEVHIIINSTSL